MLKTYALNNKPLSSKQISEKQHIKSYHIICLLYIFTLILSNISAVKITNFFGINIVSSSFFFPIMYILSSIITEVYGFRANLKILWFSSIVNFICGILLFITVLMPSAPGIETNDHFNQVITITVKIFFSCIASFLVGNYISSYFLAKTKVLFGGRAMAPRIILSSIIGVLIESIIFIAFIHSDFDEIKIAKLIIMSVVIKSLYQLIFYPITSFVIGYLKNRDKVDHFDFKTRFYIFSLK